LLDQRRIGDDYEGLKFSAGFGSDQAKDLQNRPSKIKGE